MNATIFALYLWTTVAASGGTHNYTLKPHKDWRHAGNFASVQKCETGAGQLGLKPGAYRCVDTGMVRP